MNEKEVSPKAILIKAGLIVFGIYVFTTLLWNITNSNEELRPSHIVVDLDQEGYREDILHDRYEPSKDEDSK